MSQLSVTQWLRTYSGQKVQNIERQVEEVVGVEYSYEGNASCSLDSLILFSASFTYSSSIS
jgi:hypothetical protein